MHKCNGAWELIPELSFYQEGEPPKKCVYEISVVSDNASFKLNWLQNDDQEISMSFGGVADSLPRDIESPPGAQASYTIVDNSTLDSTMYMNGSEMAYARRVVSSDGSLMSVLQSNSTPDGQRIRITQVYKRVDT